MRPQVRVRSLTDAEVALATRLAEALRNGAELIRSLSLRCGATACACGCATFSVHPDGVPCDQLGQLAAEAAAKDEQGREHMFLLFTCSRGLHEVEIVPPDNEAAGFLPTPAQVEWVVTS
jgi:hypothetical protein